MKKKLKDICTQVRGVSYKPSDLRDENSGLPILRANNIQDTGIVFDELVYVDSSKVHSEQYLLTDDIVICASSGSKNLVGKAASYKSDLSASFGAFCKVVRINNSDDLCKAYIQQYFQSKIYRNAISESSAGANINNIKTEDIEALEIPLPSKEEQQKIAAELDKIQSAIDNKKQQLSLLDEAVKSKFVEMFGENPVESGKWKVEKIASVVDKNILSVKKKFQKTDTIKYVDISAIDNISNVVTGFTEYVLLEAPSRAQQVINQNDILISTVRPNLRNIAINPFNDNFMVGSSGFCVLRVNDLCNAKYLFYCVLNDNFTNAMVDLTTGAAYPAIKDSDILAYPIALPPLDLQNQFAAFVQQIDKSKFVVKQQIADLQELLDCKMQEYFGA